MEKGGWIDSAKRFFREKVGETVFLYDPELQNQEVRNAKEKVVATTPWKRNPDGSITVGKEQIVAAIENAKAQRTGRTKEEAEQAKTALGLSLAYVRKHFPQALEDLAYDE